MAETGLAQPAKMSLARGEHFIGNGQKPLNKKMLDEATKYIAYDPFDQNWPEINRLIVGPDTDLYFRDQKSLDDTIIKIYDDMDQQKLKLGETARR